MAEIAGWNISGDHQVFGKILRGQEWLQDYQRERKMPEQYKSEKETG